MKINVTDRELATILVGLRRWAHRIGSDGVDKPAEWDIATNEGTIEPLTYEDVGILCTRLNFPEPSFWKQDEYQFPRLLCEISAVGAVTDAILAELCASMDLQPAEIDELFERAHIAWEDVIDKTCPPAPYHYAVDLPNPDNLDGECENMGYFRTKEEAIAWAKEHLCADDNGNINVVSRLARDDE